MTSSDFTSLLTRINSVGIVVLLAWMGIISSFHWEMPHQKKVSATDNHHETRSFQFIVATHVSRYPTEGIIPECSNVNRYLTCCETEQFLKCSNEGIFLQREPAVPLGYYAYVNLSSAMIGAHCKIYCSNY